MALPLREQGTLLTAVRGCDLTPKYPLDSPERHLAAWVRWCFMNPADPREVDFEAGCFFRSLPPPKFKPSSIGHYPLHWVAHVMHAVEIVAFRHPDPAVARDAASIYYQLCRSLHLPTESKGQMIARLSEDRIANGSVVS